jgi:hypothetical protein
VSVYRSTRTIQKILKSGGIMTNPFDDAVEGGGDFVDDKTGGKFEEQVDQGQEALGQKFSGGGGDSGGDIEGGGGSGDSGGDIEGGGSESGGDIESDPRN